MHVAFGRVRRRIAQLRTGFLLMKSGYSEMVLYRTHVVLHKLELGLLTVYQ